MPGIRIMVVHTPTEQNYVVASPSPAANKVARFLRFFSFFLAARRACSRSSSDLPFVSGFRDSLVGGRTVEAGGRVDLVGEEGCLFSS